MNELGHPGPDDSAAKRRLPPAGTRISLWRRDDFVVTDPDRVLAAGRARQRELWPDDTLPVERRIPDLVTAISRLLTCDDTVPLEDEAALGLVRAGSLTEVVRLEQALADQPDYEWQFDEDFDAFDRSGVIKDG